MCTSSLTKVGPDHIFYFLVFMLNDCRKCALPILNKSEVETAQNMFVLAKEMLCTRPLFLIITS